MHRQKRTNELFRALRVFGALGFNLAGTMLVGLFLGKLLDRWFGSAPWFAAGGFLLGAVAGFLKLWQLAMEEETDYDRK